MLAFADFSSPPPLSHAYAVGGDALAGANLLLANLDRPALAARCLAPCKRSATGFANVIGG